MDTIQSDNYPIYFTESLSQLSNFIKQGGYSRVFVLTDDNTAIHCLPLLQQHLAGPDNYDIIEINAGEENKNIDFCIGVWKMLIDFGADRRALLINLGGGVITDLGGFVASTYKRGIDFVHVPTTLLSQVDASVGGKTGIDMDGIKNIVGTFTQPKAVFMVDAFFKTLPQRQILSGLAEMLKHGLICDGEYWNQLKTIGLDVPSMALVHRSVQIKNNVVIEDPHEKGIRKALNFGHTIGHAVETYFMLNGNSPLTHGEAIAIGMICEAWLSNKKAGLPHEQLSEITEVLSGLYTKQNIPDVCHSQLYDLMLKDKKNFNSHINCTLLTHIGQYSIDNVCTEDELCDSLNYYATL